MVIMTGVGSQHAMQKVSAQGGSAFVADISHVTKRIWNHMTWNRCLVQHVAADCIGLPLRGAALQGLQSICIL